MNLSGLHHYLTTLSESEERYKAGEVYAEWSNLPHTILESTGSAAPLMDIESISHNRSGIPIIPIEEVPHRQSPLSAKGSHTTGRTLPRTRSEAFSDQPFSGNFIKKNSRFNPVPEHMHNYVELNYVYSGCCPQVVNGQPITLAKDQTLLIDTECPHSIDALGEDDIMISLIISREYLREHTFSQLSKESILSRFFINAINQSTEHNHYLLFHSENNRRIPLFFRELFCECLDPSINSRDILNHLFFLIMAELINVYENNLANEKSNMASSHIAPMIRYLQANFLTCTQRSVADFFHISPNYVTTLLKKYTGLSYIQMIQLLKLKYALSLLKNTELSITEVANEAGYQNVNFFYKKFHEHYHCSPKEYRMKTE